MQTRVESIHGHWVMLLIRCDNDHGVELGRGEHLLIVGEDQRDTMPAGHIGSTRPVAPADRDDVGTWMALEAAQVHALGIPCRSNHTNTNGALHRQLLL